MSQTTDQARQAVELARQALRGGQRREAWRWAAQAARLNPESEEAWLILAALASPQASISYLKKALEINPGSQRARTGMHWAVHRLRATRKAPAPAPQAPTPSRGPITRPVKKKAAVRPWAAGLIILAIVLVTGTGLWLGWRLLRRVPAIGKVEPTVASPTASQTAIQVLQPSPSPQPSLTAFAPQSPTPTPTITPTPAPTETPTPTLEPTATATLELTLPPTPAQPVISRPSGVGADEFWVDVDLSAQRLYAMLGDQHIQTFKVSTGMRGTPTVTGRFRIYVKYLHADMFGPGYYLPAVPYVMYFYEGYGLHGTYWHHNFGHPMSHGCVNLRTSDAAWIFEMANVGTIVNVHR